MTFFYYLKKLYIPLISYNFVFLSFGVAIVFIRSNKHNPEHQEKSSKGSHCASQEQKDPGWI